MKIENLKYLCKVIGDLASIPIRIYKNKRLVYYYSIVDLVKDPIAPYIDEILDIDNHIGYFTTEMFFYYGIVNSKEYKIVLGPSKQTKSNKNELKELALNCKVDIDDISSFVSSLETLLPLPLNSILQMLCSINFVLNGEKLSLSDITLHDENQDEITRLLKSEEVDKHVDINANVQAVHNTYTAEERIMNIVAHGSLSSLKELIKNAPAIRPGLLSNDALRQAKNTFIVTTTLASRAAIRGGLDVNEAFSLSDAYIQKCDLLNTIDKITDLEFHMIFDYTERVEKIRLGKNPSKFMVDISNYVQKHLTEPIDIEAMANKLHFSRTYLATKFKNETGNTLTDFILNAKIEEAKRLLRYTDKSISNIGFYLGFSSQSHFSNTFRKYAKVSPYEYKSNHKKSRLIYV